jgi:hypothetical protein
MKTLLINTAIYYVLLSIIMGIIFLLTGFTGMILVRIIISFILAHKNPIYTK